MFFSTGLIFLLILLDTVIYYLQQQQEQDDGEQKNTSSSPLSLSDQRSQQEGDHAERKGSSSSSSDQWCRRFSLAEIKLATNDFDDALVIGKGGFGKVYKGTINFGTGIDVAIKRLNLYSNQGETEFRAEIEMLSKFRHSHIVSLLGYCEESAKREMILVYEYMPSGSLEDHLHKKGANGSNSSPLTWVQRLHICIGAARALDYLHTGTGIQCRVIHRDVKSSNILLDENWTGKISDFGLSRTGPAYQSCTTNVYTDQIRGTFGYMDAEYFLTHRLTRKSDVYSFGVVLFEVLCRRPALDFSLDEQQHSLAAWAKHCFREGNIDQIVDPCLRGQVSASCLKEFAQIAYKCLHRSPKDRPTMTEVVARLEFVLALVLQKHGGRVTFIGKVWSLFSIKIPVLSNTKKKAIMTEEQLTTGVEGSSHHGGATTSRQPVPPSRQIATPNLKIFTFAEVRKATKNFRSAAILGMGGFGIVFKGWVDGVTYAPSKSGVGIPVAVKKWNPESMQGLKEGQAEVEFLGQFRHPNVVKLLGYCCENNEFLLVYEYMPKGSLENHLFQSRQAVLPWETRMKIGLGAARGLAFLHTTDRKVIYRDFKSSNILLHGDYNAKLSDFGLAKLGPVNGESHVSTMVMGTYGYAAPEYVATGHLYVKSDVYGFGVVMLEMITGLRVLDLSRPSSQHHLVDWAKPSLTDVKKLRRIMDSRLKQVYPLKGAIKAAKLTLTCLDPQPNHRPSMESVVASLEGINAIKMK